VEKLRALVRRVDRECLQAEQDRHLTAAAIEQRRSEIGQQALATLANFSHLQAAEKAVAAKAGGHNELVKALGELREGVAATRRMLVERCEMHKRVESRSYV